MNHINWTTVKKEVPDWFRDAKFGLFFHWGPYSVAEYQDEWYSRRMYERGSNYYEYHQKNFGNIHDFGYKDFYPMMRGEKFDPQAWADLVVRSGAKYAGPVSEHADHFSLWDSQVNPVNSVNYGPHTDVVGECFKAFKERGIRTLATFHHQWLWGWFMSDDVEADVYIPENEKYYGPILPLETKRANPYHLPDRAFCENWKAKVLEVVDRYDPDIIYFDSRAIIISEDCRFEMLKHFYEKKKDGIMTYKWEDFPSGTGMFDLECGRFKKQQAQPWQVDDHLEDHPTTWSMIKNPQYKSSAAVIRQLCDIVSKNGNLLLNVGPYADGSFHPEAVHVLEEVGDWLSVNGEAIYGTRPFKVEAEGPSGGEDIRYGIQEYGGQSFSTVGSKDTDLTEKDFRFTSKGDIVYAIAMGWPKDGYFHIKTLGKNDIYKKQIESVSMPGCFEPLEFSRDARGLHVRAPHKAPCRSAYVLKIR